MSRIKDIRDALASEVGNIDVSSVLSNGWAFEKRHPVKQAPGYPGYFVAPARNTPPVTIDNITQEVPYTFWIYLIHSYQDPSTNEDQLIDLADLINSALLPKLKGQKLLEGVDFDSEISGEWGFDTEAGERFYRIEVTAKTTQTITLPL